jgi:hypothetical protein
MGLESAREHLVMALNVIDGLGEFFEAEHAWLFSEDVKGQLGQRVLRRLDYLGHCVPELYEAQIHLAHALRDILVALDD